MDEEPRPPSLPPVRRAGGPPAPRERRDAASRSATWILAVALAAAAVYLGWDSNRDTSWSDWSFGDAQTLLSSQFWWRDGFLRHRLLFIAHGYARCIRFLDSPELRHLAHGTDWAVSPLVGPRLYYTHYPSGYLIAPAILWGLGLRTYPLLSKFALVLSLGGVILFFYALRRLTGAPVACLACLYYLMSRGFLRYAASLAQMPGDDLLRFAVMAATVWEALAVDGRRRRRRASLTWILLFLVAAHGFDAVFFSLIWVVGFDLVSGKRPWRRWALMAAAPLLAYALQYLQNSWYLGWADAWRDVRETYLSRARPAGFSAGLIGAALRFVFDEQVIYVRNIRHYLLPPALLRVAWAAAAAGVFWFWRRRYLSPGSLPVLLLLLVCGLAFPLLFPVAGSMAYQTRQWGPFRSLLVAAALYGSGRCVVDTLAARRLPPPRRTAIFVLSLATWAAAVLLWAVNLGTSAAAVAVSSFPIHPEDRLAALALRENRREETVYFDFGYFQYFADREHVPNFPLISPEIEYYADAPVLTFRSSGMLVSDLLTLWRLSRRLFPFRAVVLARGRDGLEEVLEEIRRRFPACAGADFCPAGPAWTMDLTPVLQSLPDEVLDSSRLPPPLEGRYVGLPREKNLLAGAAVSASSRLSSEFDVANLMDGDPQTRWQVSPHPAGSRDWVLADLGAGRSAAARILAAQASPESPEGFLQCARLQGSRDGQDWEEIAPIMASTPPRSGEWRFWDLPPKEPFRFYKVIIYSGHATRELPFRFSSLAELALY